MFENDISLARDYLARNSALREAVGACANDALTPRRLGAGEHNLNYTFDVPSANERYVLRINVQPQPFHNDQVGYEFGALQALRESGRTPLPMYLDNSESAPAEGALVIGFCEGNELDFDNLKPGDLECVAQIMADVHAVHADRSGSLFRPDNPLQSLYEECVSRYESYQKSAYEAPRITKWVELFLKEARKTLSVPCVESDCSHIINTETLPSHFLIPDAPMTANGKSGGNTGPLHRPGWFVDWERPIIGEVAQDVAYFVSPTTTFWDSDYLFPSNEVDAFVEEYWRAVDDRFERGNFDERFRAYRMMTVLRSVTWCCRALIAYSGASGAHTTEKTRNKLPIYLSDDFMERIALECFGL